MSLPLCRIMVQLGAIFGQMSECESKFEYRFWTFGKFIVAGYELFIIDKEKMVSYIVFFLYFCIVERQNIVFNWLIGYAVPLSCGAAYLL